MSARVATLRDGLNLSSMSGIEIGPLCRPIVRKEEGQITYVDYADAETLRRNYRDDPHVPTDQIVHVDLVWSGTGSLSDQLPNGSVDYILASHVAEHVPNLIGWLNEMRSALKPNGELRLVLPDWRFGFDFRRQQSTFADIGAAYLVGAQRPSVRDVLDFRLNVVDDCDSHAIHQGLLTRENAKLCHTPEVAWQAATSVRDHPDVYFDVHCLVASPRRFAELMGEAARLGLMTLACSRFVDTAPENWFEFYVFLTPCDDQEKTVASWKRMAEQAADPLPGSSLSEASELTVAHERIAALEVELEQQAALAERWAAEHAAVAESLHEIRASTSWRATRHARRLAELLRSRKRGA